MYIIVCQKNIRNRPMTDSFKIATTGYRKHHKRWDFHQPIAILPHFSIINQRDQTASNRTGLSILIIRYSVTIVQQLYQICFSGGKGGASSGKMRRDTFQVSAVCFSQTRVCVREFFLFFWGGGDPPNSEAACASTKHCCLNISLLCSQAIYSKHRPNWRTVSHCTKSTAHPYKTGWWLLHIHMVPYIYNVRTTLTLSVK